MRNINNLLNTKQFKEALSEAEKEVYTAAYKYTGGNQSLTAKLLGVSRGTFISRMKKWQLDEKNLSPIWMSAKNWGHTI